MPVYQPGIPTGTVNLDVDYQNIQDNFSQLDVCFNVDHVTFSNTTAQTGYHKSIHFNPVSTTATNVSNNYDTPTQYPQGVPATVAGIGQLFSSEVNDAISVDTGLYWKTGNGLKVAMTRNFVPSRAANGYTFLPGGLILQWGVFVRPGGGWPTTDQTLTFTTQVPANIAFPNACLAVFTTFTGNSGSSGDIGINSKNLTNFHWQFGGNAAAQYTGFYWQAIGY